MAGDRDTYGCDYFIQKAKALGATDAEIALFAQYNRNADGSWDCNRLLDAFGGAREQSVGSVTPAQVAAAAAILPPPTLSTGTTNGDPRMFLTLSGLPDSSGSAVPDRAAAQFASSPLGSGLFSGAGAGASGGRGFNFNTLLILALIAGAAWYLMKGR